MTSPVSTYLGYGPIQQPLLLVAGTTFVQNITPSPGGTFPAGTTVSLNLLTPMGASLGSWAGTVTSGQVSWSVSNSVADLIPANSRYEIVVTYPTSPPTVQCWFAGAVLRDLN